MRRIIFSQQARKDLVEIWKYLRGHNVHAAVQVFEKIEGAIHDLSNMPGMGHTRPDVPDPRYRVWSVYSYLIAYRFDARTMSVARVIHGARDLRKLFPPQSPGQP